MDSSHIAFKNQGVLLAPNIGIADEVAICPIPDATAVFSKVEDDVLAHVEQTVCGYLWTTLIVAIEYIMVDGYVADGSFVEVGNQQSFEFAQLLNWVGISKQIIAESDVGGSFSEVDALPASDVCPTRIQDAAVVHNDPTGPVDENAVYAGIQDAHISDDDVGAVV